MDVFLSFKKMFWFVSGGSKLVIMKMFDGLDNIANFPSKWPETQQRIINTLKLNSEDRLLDAGCARGDLIRVLLPLVKLAYGIDISHKNIEIAKMNFANESKCTFYVAEFKNIPVGDAFFTAICCVGSFYYVKPSEREAVLQEFNRLLERGGRLLLCDLVIKSKDKGWGFYMWKISPEELEMLATATGFTFQICRQPVEVGDKILWDAILYKN